MISSLAIVLGLLALLSFLLNLWQFVVAMRFPLHRRIPDPAFTPAVTVLKPLKGCDNATEKCLRSWMTQKYQGQVEVLFGVGSADDPVIPLVERLLREHPDCDGQLVTCPDRLGANAKVSTLAQLEARAGHAILVISDADVWIPPDLLANLVAPLRAPEVGLVHCLYLLANPTSLAMRCSALAINADFWSQVLQALHFKRLRFALGATMAVRRAELAAIGGFFALRDYLADDYQLGHRIATRGRRITLCSVPVECWEPAMNWAAVLEHQVRWARTIRTCQPLPYFLSILGNATVWHLLWLFVYPTHLALGATLLALLWRTLSVQILQNRLTRKPPHPADASLALVRDLLGAAIWLAAFLGRRIRWRGQTFRVLRGGKLL